MMKNQSGVAYIVIVGLTLAVLLVLAVTLSLIGFKGPVQKAKDQQSTTTVIKQGEGQQCPLSDYGGCDSGKNFYEWKDDGLRK